MNEVINIGYNYITELTTDIRLTRDENLGEFIQRVAEIGIKYQAIIDKCIHI